MLKLILALGMVKNEARPPSFAWTLISPDCLSEMRSTLHLDKFLVIEAFAVSVEDIFVAYVGSGNI